MILYCHGQYIVGSKIWQLNQLKTYLELNIQLYVAKAKLCFIKNMYYEKLV